MAYWDDGYSSARYGFIGFVVAALLIFVIGTCLVNRRRLQQGRTPFVSSYLAPPSYAQASGDSQTQPLPAYTADANPNQDVGYYDPSGNFVPTQVPAVEEPNKFVPLQDLPPVHQRTDNSIRHASTGSVFASDQYQRPDGPPPGVAVPQNLELPSYEEAGSSSAPAPPAVERPIGANPKAQQNPFRS